MVDFVDAVILEARVNLRAKKTGPGTYLCTLSSDYGEMIREITVKEGVKNAPDAGQLLYHFALLSQGVVDCDDLADWAEDYGHDASDDAIKARYGQYCTDAKDLRTLLGGYSFENLMSGLAIAQAIGNARPG